MAGYVIHIAVAQEYLKNHSEIIENKEEFIEGVIYPDSVSDKSLTHYGEKSSKVVLKDFLNENNIDTSFKRGYFLHLVTDYLFYNKYLEYFSKDIYNDYDVINESLIKKYNVELPQTIQDKVFYKDGKTKILSLKLAEKIIDEISCLNLYEIEEEIKSKSNNEKWLKYNNKI